MIKVNFKWREKIEQSTSQIIPTAWQWEQQHQTSKLPFDSMCTTCEHPSY